MLESKDFKTIFKRFYYAYFYQSELIYLVHLAMADPVNEGQSACVSHQLFKTSRVGEKKYVLVCLYTMTRPKWLIFAIWSGLPLHQFQKN